MKIIIDACSIILLTKASVFEILLKEHTIFTTDSVYREVIKGKEKMFEDALILERVLGENKIKLIDCELALLKKLSNDFNMGEGEASIIAAGIKDKNLIVATDNIQGRKVAKINNLNVIGSIEIIVSLNKKNKINKEKAINALKLLKENGWFNAYLIENAEEDLK